MLMHACSAYTSEDVGSFLCLCMLGLLDCVSASRLAGAANGHHHQQHQVDSNGSTASSYPAVYHSSSNGTTAAAGAARQQPGSSSGGYSTQSYATSSAAGYPQVSCWALLPTLLLANLGSNLQTALGQINLMSKVYSAEQDCCTRTVLAFLQLAFFEYFEGSCCWTLFLLERTLHSMPGGGSTA
jgi:hypothetical protein